MAAETDDARADRRLFLTDRQLGQRWPPVGKRPSRAAGRRPAAGRPRLLGPLRAAARFRPAGRHRRSRRQWRYLHRRDQIVGRRFPHRPQVARLPVPLRPVVLRHACRRARRDLSRRCRPDRRRRLWRRRSQGCSQPSAGRGDAPGDDAALRPGGRKTHPATDRSPVARHGSFLNASFERRTDGSLCRKGHFYRSVATKSGGVAACRRRGGRYPFHDYNEAAKETGRGRY
ncbi:hypothetical protein KL86PLE_60048 [uncultured Pleomorphomonas sp.]|uniref:Uncharacterized protein n=1 Tax=uncultured Pleomorphomonas sp. TaxID=442121 RepID=A0A212LJM9_9HYPH|nr:hypothetical protein KL86PLE_60048 [uncultured Pleomorphomonas sp.]